MVVRESGFVWVNLAGWCGCCFSVEVCQNRLNKARRGRVLWWLLAFRAFIRKRACNFPGFLCLHNQKEKPRNNKLQGFFWLFFRRGLEFYLCKFNRFETFHISPVELVENLLLPGFVFGGINGIDNSLRGCTFERLELLSRCAVLA